MVLAFPANCDGSHQSESTSLPAAYVHAGIDAVEDADAADSGFRHLIIIGALWTVSG
jgi:hypothetical protein